MRRTKKDRYFAMYKGDKYVDGEHWAIDQDIFERTYERVD